MSVTPKMIAVALLQAAPVSGSLQEQQWELFIADAELLIEDRRLKVSPAVELSTAKVDYVVREAVVAHIKKPDDATQVTVSIDDGSSSKTYQSGKGRVTIIDEWWKFLDLVEPNAGAYSFDTAPGQYVAHLPWCNLMWGASYCSCGSDIAGRPIYEGRGW